MKTKRIAALPLMVTVAFGMVLTNTSFAEGGDADLAQELTNPIANIVTIPIQINVDDNLGLNDKGSRTTTNIQPVIPFQVNADWNLITRTIFPYISQDDVFAGQGSQSGFGDITEQLFFSPKKPASGGVIWGVGAVMIVPTATDSLLGSEKWSLGPAGIAITTLDAGCAG